MQQHGERSVDEILDSIKKVIARDNREAAKIERSRRETEGVVLQDARTEAAMAKISEALADTRPQAHIGPETNIGAEEVLDLGDAATPVDDGPPEGLQASTPDDQLTTDDAADKVRQSFAALEMLASPSSKAGGGTSLDEVARELLRPMLAQWLDTNMPEIVERLVREEIARLAGAGN